MKKYENEYNFFKVLAEKKGKISTKDFEKYNIPFELFLKVSQIDNEKLENIAKMSMKRIEEYWKIKDIK